MTPVVYLAGKAAKYPNTDPFKMAEATPVVNKSGSEQYESSNTERPTAHRALATKQGYKNAPQITQRPKVIHMAGLSTT
jgi:hypothetical protein